MKAGITVPALDDNGKPLLDQDGRTVLKAKYTGLHALRHFFGAWSLTRLEYGGLGLTLKELQERLGHATLAMTADVYGHLMPAQDDAGRLAKAERSMFGVT